MTFAVIESGGKQYRVAVGDVVSLEKLSAENGKVTFENVLLLDDGKETKVGAPYLSGVTVQGEVMEEGRKEKVSVVRYKAKSRYFKRRGHRQPYTKIRIASIGGAGRKAEGKVSTSQEKKSTDTKETSKKKTTSKK